VVQKPVQATPHQSHTSALWGQGLLAREGLRGLLAGSRGSAQHVMREMICSWIEGAHVAGGRVFVMVGWCCWGLSQHVEGLRVWVLAMCFRPIALQHTLQTMGPAAAAVL
jgi:hypothetical protein